MKFKRERLNNKGFTLIELLAVVVILAIVMGIAGTSVINSINNSRRSTLHSAAVTAANNINTWVMEDALVQDDKLRKLGDNFETTYGGGSWVCLTADGVIQNGDSATTLLNALGFTTTDIVISTNNPWDKTQEKYIVDEGTCSAIRYNSNVGAYELLLVAKSGGKYYVTSDKEGTHYAFSRANTYATLISD